MSVYEEYRFIFGQIRYDIGDSYGVSNIYDKIKEHIKNLIKKEKDNNGNERIFINNMLIKIVSELITTGYSPYAYISEEFMLDKLSQITFENIVHKGMQWLDRYKLCRCNIFLCFNKLEINYNRDIVYKIIRKYICDYGIVPTCKFLFLSYQYYIQEKKVGSLQEISDYELLLNEIENDPEEFHNKHKLKIPTRNLLKLEYKIMSTELFEKKQPGCGLCQCDIEPSQKYYELPCGHCFHHSDNDCLECATIIFWLKNNKFCPICKQEVIL
jgi:hypothetical protein